MNFANFKSGAWRQQFQYKSFFPAPVNVEWTWNDPRLNVLLEKTGRALSELNAYTRIVPDVNLFIRMHILTEANRSSRIEGTRTKIAEDILPIEEIAPEKRDDWREVQNYVAAMEHAVAALETLPLSFRLLKDTHAILLSRGRGMDKGPGKIRTSQNWIGGNSIAQAVFVPPHHEDLPPLIADLEAFWHNDAIQVPLLVRAAISHYQFETLHPFQDGNGRIGRLLIPLYLIDKKLLAKPSLYLSAFLERHRVEYYDALTRVRVSNDLRGWCHFFLQAVYETAASGKNTFERILALTQEMNSTVTSLGRRTQNAHRLVQRLYSTPYVTIPEVEAFLNIQRNPAAKLVETLQHAGILSEMTGSRRNRIYLFKRYLDLFHES